MGGWHSTPDGLYSGIHDNIPVDYYRGKLVTDSQGNYRVRTTMPVPYQIPYEGPTGRLLGHLGSHTWRPAHVHFRSEEHTSELQSLMRISYAVFCLKKKKKRHNANK